MDEVAQLRETAWNLYRIGRHDEAAQRAVEGLSRAQDDPGLLRLLGEIALDDDAFDEAERQARRAVGAARSVESLHLLARVLDAMGRLDEALDALGAAISLDPDRAGPFATRSLMRSRAHLRSEPPADRDPLVDIERARSDAETAIERDPDLALAHFAAGAAAMAAGELTAAAAHVEDALAIDSEWAHAHLMLGSIRGRQGMVKLASRHFTAAGRLDPENEVAIGTLRQLAGADRGRVGHLVERLFGARSRPEPAHLVPEARQVLATDRALRGLR